jgi:hypothetical protein
MTGSHRRSYRQSPYKRANTPLPDIKAVLAGYMIFLHEEKGIPSRYTVTNSTVRKAGLQSRSLKGTYHGQEGVFVWVEPPIDAGS